MFFTDIKTFCVLQNNKPGIDATNKLNEHRKLTPTSAFPFSTLSKTESIFRCIGRMTENTCGQVQ